MRQNKKKLHNSAGFTLAETLLAVVILLLVTATVAAGIPVVRNAYEKVVLASNAEVLLSTTITSLRNELGTAQDVETSKDEAGKVTIITFYNNAVGARSRLSVDSENGIMFQRYVGDGTIQGQDATRLISEEAATGKMYVTYDSVSFDKDTGIMQFEGLKVQRGSGNAALASRDQFSIRVISY